MCEDFNFKPLLVAYHWLLEIVNALQFWPKFFWKDNLSNAIKICCVFLDIWVWDISTMLWDTLFPISHLSKTNIRAVNIYCIKVTLNF